MTYGNFKDLPRRTASDTLLYDKAFKIAKKLKYNGYLRGLVSMIYKFFDEKSSGSAVTRADKSAIRSDIMTN